MLTRTYIDAISKGFPGVFCSSTGNGSIYDDLVWEGGLPMPTKQELDNWIIADTKACMWELIKEERDRRKSNGVKIGAHWFHTDDSSRIQHIGLVLMGTNMPAGIMWKTMTGDFVQMTPTLAGQIFQSIGAQDIAIFTVAEQHRALMMQSATPETYNYLTGWPLTYGE